MSDPPTPPRQPVTRSLSFLKVLLSFYRPTLVTALQVLPIENPDNHFLPNPTQQVSVLSLSISLDNADKPSFCNDHPLIFWTTNLVILPRILPTMVKVVHLDLLLVVLLMSLNMVTLQVCLRVILVAMMEVDRVVPVDLLVVDLLAVDLPVVVLLLLLQTQPTILNRPSSLLSKASTPSSLGLLLCIRPSHVSKNLQHSPVPIPKNSVHG